MFQSGPAPSLGGIPIFRLAFVALVGLSPMLNAQEKPPKTQEKPIKALEKSEPIRRDIVAAIRTSLALDQKDFSRRAKELDDILVSAKNGIVDSSSDQPIKPPSNPGISAFIFRSVKAKRDFIEESEAAIKARETIHQDAAKDLKKVIGFMGMPKMGAIGNLTSTDKGVSITVEKIIDARNAVLNYNYPSVKMVEVRGRGEAPPKVLKQVINRERFVLSDFDTKQFVEGKPIELDQVFYVSDFFQLSDSRLVRALPVVLTDAEMRLVGEK
jgi:hypothetical protein